MITFPKSLNITIKIIVILFAITFIAYPFIPSTVFEKKSAYAGTSVLIDGQVFSYNPNLSLYVLTGDTAMAKFEWLWSYIGFRELGLAWRIGIVLLLVIPWFLRFKKQEKNEEHEDNKNISSNILTYLLIFLASAIIFYIFKADPEKSANFADAYFMPHYLGDNAFNYAPYPKFVLQWIQDAITAITSLWGRAAAVYTFQILDAITGGIFMCTIYILASLITKNKWEKVLLMMALALATYLLNFFGHLETSQIPLAATAAYITCGIAYIYNAGENKKWLYACIGSFIIMLSAHKGAVLASPSLLFIAFYQRSRINIRDILKNKKTIICITLIGIFYLIVIAPQGLEAQKKDKYVLGLSTTPVDYGSKKEYGMYNSDNMAYVESLNEVVKDVAKTRTLPYVPYMHVHYGMFQIEHLSDVLQGMITAAPSLILFIPIAWYAKKRKLKLQDSEKKSLWFIIALTVAPALYQFIWAYTFSFRGDWNISTLYFFPVNVLCWLYIFFIIRNFEKRNEIYFKILLPCIGVQIILALSLYLQLI